MKLDKILEFIFRTKKGLLILIISAIFCCGIFGGCSVTCLESENNCVCGALACVNGSSCENCIKSCTGMSREDVQKQYESQNVCYVCGIHCLGLGCLDFDCVLLRTACATCGYSCVDAINSNDSNK